MLGRGVDCLGPFFVANQEVLIALSALFTALFTGVLFITSAGLWWVTERSLRHAESEAVRRSEETQRQLSVFESIATAAVDHAKVAHENMERAYGAAIAIGVNNLTGGHRERADSYDKYKIGVHLNFQFEIKNAGSAAAAINLITIDIFPNDKWISKRPDAEPPATLQSDPDTSSRPFRRQTILKRDESFSITCIADIRVENDCIPVFEGENSPFIRGLILYDDLTFDVERQIQFRFDFFLDQGEWVAKRRRNG